MKKVSAGIICRNGKMLICQRPEGKTLAGYWEFPGGKLEEGETMPECLKRELKEELGIDAQIGKFFMESVYKYDFGEIALSVYFAEIDAAQELILNVHPRVEWIDPADLDKYTFAPADLPITAELKKYFAKLH